MPNTTPNRGYPYPLYSDPSKDFPAASAALADALDTDVTDLEAYTEDAYQRPSARVISGVSQSIATSTTTTVSFAGGATDYGNGITPDLTATGGLTLTEAGVYLVAGYVLFPAPATGGIFSVSLSLASSKATIPMISRTSMYAIAAQETWVSVSGLHFNDGVGSDSIRMEVWQNAGASRNITFRQITATKTSATIGGS